MDPKTKKVLISLANIIITIVWVLIFLGERANPGLFYQSIWLVIVPTVILLFLKKDLMVCAQLLLIVTYCILVVVTINFASRDMEVILYPVMSFLVAFSIIPLIYKLQIYKFQKKNTNN